LKIVTGTAPPTEGRIVPEVHERERDPASAALTVVVPVWNEGENLRTWWRDAAPHLPPGARVLVVYDRADDDTLPVARALAAEGAPIVPLRNAGAGFPGAMLTGLRAADRGPVLVTMGDASDDAAALPAMLAEYWAGADLVVGSRFIPGGRMEGGHVLKATLARWGSLVLSRVACFPAHDVSNAFRLYDAALVRRLRVEEAAGFDVVFAILLAAWQDGARIAEVPVTWRDRRRGTSRFRLRWIPRYARLWLRAVRHGLASRIRGREAPVGRGDR
jgi:dolichol-phosphate mannosyltransferase